jgi:acyl carrier protein
MWLAAIKLKENVMFETLKQYLVEELRVNADDITMEAELIGDLGINSLELADLVLLCEERFNVTIDDEDLHNFITVGDVVRYVEAAQ